MEIEFEVTGGTHKTVKSAIHVSNNLAGELSMNRDDFTRFCDLVFAGCYIIKPKNKNHVTPE